MWRRNPNLFFLVPLWLGEGEKPGGDEPRWMGKGIPGGTTGIIAGWSRGKQKSGTR